MTCGAITPSSCTCNARNLAGVGTELRNIIPKILKGKACKCEDVAAWMDRIGIEGCEKNYEKLVDHLVSQAKRITVGMAPAGVAEKVARKWLDQAIQQAKDKRDQAS